MTSGWILAILAYVAISRNSLVHGCGGAAGGAAVEGVGAVGGIGRVVGDVSHGIGAGIPLGMPIGPGKCIYDEAQVRMANGAKKLVKHLQIGDEVLAYSVEKGVHPSRIFGQLHVNNETTVKIFEIETSSGRKIPVTAVHSLFARQCLSDGQKWTTKSAFEIGVGECLPRYYTDGDVVEDPVTNIRVFEARGIRQPVSETGTIMVDDVVISCYDRVVNQDATHMALFPYRWLLGLTQTYATQVKSLVPSLINWINFDTSLF
jgi:hypothetical protein